MTPGMPATGIAGHRDCPTQGRSVTTHSLPMPTAGVTDRANRFANNFTNNSTNNNDRITRHLMNVLTGPRT